MAAKDDFQRAAGSFRYLESHFRNAPSMDMQSDTLSMLSVLLLVRTGRVLPLCLCSSLAGMYPQVTSVGRLSRPYSMSRTFVLCC